MPSERKLPEALRTALLPLETLEDLVFLETWRWNEKNRQWTVKCRLTARDEKGTPLAAPTDWFVRVSEVYPFGDIDISPAKENGLTGTYPHQNYNCAGDLELPWRTGKLCLNTSLRVLGRHGYDIEPYAAQERLLWHCSRAIDWLRAAYTNSLALLGEPFEIPHSPTESLCLIAFSEDRESFEVWSRQDDVIGEVAAFELKVQGAICVIEAFHRLDQGVLQPARWGKYMRQHHGDFQNGLWIRLNSVPVLEPWRLPETWGELRLVLSSQGIDLNTLLKGALKKFRDDKSHFILLGFPIPRCIGEAPVLMHWLAIRLPILSKGEQYSHGFRPNEQGYWTEDRRTKLANREKLSYMRTENWHQEQISTRGRLSEEMRLRKVAIVGCGALGAPIAEMLVRGGVHDILLVDGEQMHVGNLTRHTLSLDAVGRTKSTQLAEHLNALSPHDDSEGIVADLSIDNSTYIERLRDRDLIIDCTGSDEFLQALATIQFPKPVVMVSCSMGFRAKRLFLYSAENKRFSADDYHLQISPWLQDEQDDYAGEAFPREGIGCYHPVFPARCDDMWLWGSLAVKVIERICLDAPLEPVLHVFEQSQDEDGLPVVRRTQGTA